MSIQARLDKLDRAMEAHYVAEYRAVGQKLGYYASEGELRQMALEHVEMLRKAPPKPMGKGLVDIEPTLRFMAQQQGWDVADVLDEARRVIADMEASQ